MTHWIAEGDTPDGVRCIWLDGIKAGLPRETRENVPVIRVGDGPADKFPAHILPADPGRAADLAQSQPVDRVSGWVRLWLLGLLEHRPGWDGVVCATYGEVTHWIEISADEAVSCRSALTLRFCRLFGGHSSLSEEALASTISRPERVVTDLYSAELNKDGEAVAGHLLGAEMAAMRPYWLGRDVALLSEQPALYASALAAQGVPATVYDPEALLSDGLAVLARARGFAES